MPEPSVMWGETLGTINVNTSVPVNQRLVIDRVRGGDRSQTLEVGRGQSEEIERAKLKRDIAQTVNRLKGRIEKSLKSSKPAVQERLLFDRTEEGNGRLPVPRKGTPN